MLVAWVGLVGLARVALQVHFVSDVVGGWSVGMLIGLTLQAAL
jgi:membrane-associated phospholipid phosphatase